MFLIIPRFKCLFFFDSSRGSKLFFPGNPRLSCSKMFLIFEKSEAHVQIKLFLLKMVYFGRPTRFLLRASEFRLKAELFLNFGKK